MQTQCLLKSDQKIEMKEISVFHTFHILQMHNMCKEIFAMKFQCELYKCYVSLLTCFVITVFFALILLITCKHNFAKNAMMLNILWPITSKKHGGDLVFPLSKCISSTKCFAKLCTHCCLSNLESWSSVMLLDTYHANNNTLLECMSLHWNQKWWNVMINQLHETFHTTNAIQRPKFYTQVYLQVGIEVLIQCTSFFFVSTG